MKVMRDLVGDVLSHRYRLVGRIAGGGMGEVYRGHDLLLDRTVAVKVLQPSLAADPDLVGRFRNEARAAARLSHPNIVAVHDWGSEDDRTYYMVMEYVSGTDLRDLLVRRGSIDPSHAASIMAAVCDALSVAHAGGVVHRDVKPENILLARDGTVKVADFGIAAVVDVDRTAPGGSIPGTLRYLSPEQARGEEATAASDVWAAGAVLAELVVGASLNNGTGAELLRRRASEPIKGPSSYDPTVPVEIDEIVLKACALEPDDRYEDAADMARDLRALSGAAAPEAPPVDLLLDHVTGEIRLPDMEPTTFVSSRMRRRQLKRRARIRAVMVVVLLLLLIGGGARAAAWLFAPDMVPVPDLTGKPKKIAIAMAEAEGLEVKITGRERTLDHSRGDVLSQTPDDGELQEGSAIKVVISAGPPLHRVPDLMGLTTREAKMRLSVYDMTLGKRDYEYSNKPAGSIIAYEGAGKRLPWGSEINATVSKGPRPTPVPDVLDMKATKAEQLIRDTGLVPIMIDAYSDEVPKGKVISTDPIADEMIAEGSEVKVYVSIGPEFKKIKMPDVRGMGVDDARTKLENLDLRVQVIQSCKGGQTVVETDPVAGETVRENEKVALFVC
ncbi:MAG: PASTA domain-containing protein [Actinomycetota bacterium]